MNSRFVWPQNTERTWFLLAIAIIVMSLAAGCQGAFLAPGATSPAPAADQPTDAAQPAATPIATEPVTLKVGYVPVLAGAPIFIAQDKGYFAAEGLTIELQSFRSGALIIPPLVLGQLDVGFGEIGPAIYNAVAQDLDVRAVATASSQPAGFGSVPLLVRTDLYESGAVATVADLRGRTVAVNLERSMAEYLLAEALAQADMTVDDVTLVSLPFPDMPAAFANSAIDAAVLPHPLAAQALGAGHAKVLMAGDLVTENPQLAIISFGPRLLDPNEADVATRFLAAYLRGVRDLVGEGWQQDENVAIISQYTNVPASAVRGGVPPYFDPNGAINGESVSRSQAYFLARGYLEYQTALSVDNVVNAALLEQALERVGRVE